MMQPYCRAKIQRGELIEDCGRVLSTDGRCDREARHVPAGHRTNTEGLST